MVVKQYENIRCCQKVRQTGENYLHKGIKMKLWKMDKGEEVNIMDDVVSFNKYVTFVPATAAEIAKECAVLPYKPSFEEVAIWAENVCSSLDASIGCNRCILSSRGGGCLKSLDNHKQLVTKYLEHHKPSIDID